jgi:hypothetical protein
MEAGYTVAGTLIWDAADNKPLPRKARRQIRQVIGTLAWLARSDRLPNYAIVGGWDDKPPPDADALLDDDVALSRWCRDRYDICVRVTSRGRSHIRIDSDLMLQMGVIPTLH